MALYPDIFEAVNAALGPEVIASTSILFGAENLARQDAPRRIVWVPTIDSFSEAQQRGSVQGDPRALHTVDSGIDVHLWGTGTADALLLRDQFLRALRTSLGPNYRLRGGGIQNEAIVSAGRLYVLSIVIRIPITDATPAVAQPPITVPTTTSFSPGHPGP